jgi:FkbM family methyltransferase
MESGGPPVKYLRPDTYDASIWHSVGVDYPTLPESFKQGEVVVDIGSHIGAFCERAADRGATVVGFEANRENHALARMNLLHLESVRLHLMAVWRSEDVGTSLLFTPSAASDNTGGGSVLFGTAEEHWEALPGQAKRVIPPELRLSTHSVPTVALDDILRGIGNVRFLKIDVEGAEYPIFLTARELRRVSEIAGEYHSMTDEQMRHLAPAAVVGHERYTGSLLQDHLQAAGFDVTLHPTTEDRGIFVACRGE